MKAQGPSSFVPENTPMPATHRAGWLQEPGASPYSGSSLLCKSRKWLRLPDLSLLICREGPLTGWLEASVERCPMGAVWQSLAPCPLSPALLALVAAPQGPLPVVSAAKACVQLAVSPRAVGTSCRAPSSPGGGPLADSSCELHACSPSPFYAPPQLIYLPPEHMCLHLLPGEVGGGGQA